MTNEQAIKLLHRLQDEQFDGIHGDERREALEMAVRALSGDGDIISRQQALNAITEIDDGTNMDIYTNEVRELLRELPSAYPTQTNAHPTQFYALDCVSRQAAIDLANELYQGVDIIQATYDDIRKAIVAFINLLPSAQPEPSQVARDIATIIENEKDMRVIAQPERKKGEWEEIEVIPEAYDIAGVKTWASMMRCNQCGFTTFAIEGHFAQYDFCPSCGADMRGGSK